MTPHGYSASCIVWILVLASMACRRPPVPQAVWDGDLVVGDGFAFEAFDQLEVLRGSLIVKGTSLRRIDFPSLRVVGGNVHIESNENLKNLEGLRDLVGVLGNVFLEKNASLSSLEGLENLTWVGGNFEVVGSQSLKSLKGVEGLLKVGQDLILRNNRALVSVDALADLRTVDGWIEITTNPSLKSLTPLDPARVGGDVIVSSDGQLEEDIIEDWLVRLRSNRWSGARKDERGLGLSRHGGGGGRR